MIPAGVSATGFDLVVARSACTPHGRGAHAEELRTVAAVVAVENCPARQMVARLHRKLLALDDGPPTPTSWTKGAFATTSTPRSS